jgi:uncharacterized protein YqeY
MYRDATAACSLPRPYLAGAFGKRRRITPLVPLAQPNEQEQGTRARKPSEDKDVLRDDINSALKAAMKAGQERRVSTLRLINAAILERETRGAERTTLSDPEIVDVMQKMVKQRHEALELYEKAGRSELAAQEREEIEIISAYLPKQMSDLDAAHAISTLIKEIEAETLKDMGRTMAALKQRFAGQMDFSKAGAQVKKLLGGGS